MYPQHRTFSFMMFLFIAVQCLVWLPVALARNVESPKNEAHDVPGGGKGGSNQFSLGPSAYYAAKRNLRAILLNPKEFQQPKVHGKTPLNLDLADLLLEYEEDDRNKRFDDYGHMRFGKRGGEEQFDDYGHMRFGRSA